jgi:hypothetical protein
MNPIHIPKPYFSKIHLILILHNYQSFQFSSNSFFLSLYKFLVITGCLASLFHIFQSVYRKLFIFMICVFWFPYVHAHAKFYFLSAQCFILFPFCLFTFCAHFSVVTPKYCQEFLLMPKEFYILEKMVVQRNYSIWLVMGVILWCHSVKI